jgi:hypothetical protein
VQVIGYTQKSCYVSKIGSALPLQGMGMDDYMLWERAVNLLPMLVYVDSKRSAVLLTTITCCGKLD